MRSFDRFKDDDRCISKLLHGSLPYADRHRGYDRVHASDLTRGSFCPREVALVKELGREVPPRAVSTSEAVTYHLGRVLQNSVIQWLADVDRVVTDWTCSACSQLHPFQRRPVRCERCRRDHFVATEARFVWEAAGITAGIDLFFRGDVPKLRPVEVKTIDKDQFKKLAAPLAEHRLRTILYLQVLRESGDPRVGGVDTSRATVLYVSKGGYGCAQDWMRREGVRERYSPFKEYVVTRDDEVVRAYLTKARAAVGHSRGEGMPSGVCKTLFERRAQGCPVAKECFGDLYPAEVHWQGDES